jgi:hypothetical protein
MTPSQFAHEKLQLALWRCGIGFALLFFGAPEGVIYCCCASQKSL